MDYTIRKMHAGDVDELVDLVRKCYGDSYPNKIMYAPAEIIHALENGLLHSVVSLDPGGKLVGHCALTFEHPDAPLPEAGKMIVDPDARGQHLSNHLADHRKAVAQENYLVGYWSECVTNHPFSQHEIIDSGGYETGAFIAKDSPTWHMAGVNNVTDVRLSLMTFYVPMRDAPARTLYLPEPYASFAQTLAAALGMTRDIKMQGDPEPVSTVFTVKLNIPNQFAMINVSVVGADIVDKIGAEIDVLKSSGIEVVHLDIPLDHPNVLHALPDLEALGFFWAAWLPEYTSSGDVLRLQRTDARINPDEIVCAREHGERIKAHVLAEHQRVMQRSSIKA